MRRVRGGGEVFHRFGPGGMVILAGVCLLFFGNRLPG